MPSTWTINALTVQVKSWYGKFPVRLRIRGEKCPILVVKLGVSADRTNGTFEGNGGTALSFGL
jgi:hypothetical protein